MDGVDDVDERLVRELQRDGRVSFETLARHVGLARSSVRTRVQRLVDARQVRVIGAIHPSVFGLEQLGHVTVRADGPVQEIAAAVAAMPESSFVTTTTGRFALTAELRTVDLPSFAVAVSEIQGIAGVHTVQVLNYLHIWKDPYFPPGTLQSIDLDAADHALLTALRRDGRASFTELAAATGITAGTARSRVLRLLDSGLVHIGALVRLDPLGDGRTVGFALQLHGEAGPVADKICGFEEVDSLVVGVGWCNAIGTIRVGNDDEVFATLERIRALPGVRTVESWSHLRAIKEENDLARRDASTG
ncbi:Lrp/AsnC family transcriptional regulator [Microlunatus soli]|uniref:Lrp/AsnC family transcriptional regulator n=1 Tax=Microlunatus soli TaxID=630515 RepID=UPI000B83DB6A|nr:Lrp/AsnC family transcriptional regulator [Microlunatus soli]